MWLLFAIHFVSDCCHIYMPLQFHGASFQIIRKEVAYFLLAPDLREGIVWTFDQMIVPLSLSSGCSRADGSTQVDNDISWQLLSSWGSKNCILLFADLGVDTQIRGDHWTIILVCYQPVSNSAPRSLNILSWDTNNAEVWSFSAAVSQFLSSHIL